MRIQRFLKLAGLALLIILAGCISQPSPAASTPQTLRPSHVSPESGDCAKWVSFYGLSGPSQESWAPDRISIAYTLPDGVNVLFVAFDADGTVLGAEHESTQGYEGGITADGDGINLEEPLDSEHTINVVAYNDVNNNQQFNLGTDEPCKDEDGVIETGPREIDFSQFEADEQGTQSPG